MPRITVIYDPEQCVTLSATPESGQWLHERGVRHATIDVDDGLEGLDIYATANKLATLLLEQVSVESADDT